MNKKILKQKEFYEKRFSEVKRFEHNLNHPIICAYNNRLLDKGLSDIKNFDRVLDFGCGQGVDSVLLSKRFKKVNALDLVNSIAVRQNIPNISFSIYKGGKLPYPDDTFDVVFCRDVLHHVGDVIFYLKEFRRVLKPNGGMIAIEANPFNPTMALIGLVYFSVDKGVFGNSSFNLKKMFDNAGFKNIKLIKTEFFPRLSLFYHNSPLSRIKLHMLNDKLMSIENFLDKLPFINFFANYIIITSRPNK